MSEEIEEFIEEEVEEFRQQDSSRAAHCEGDNAQEQYLEGVEIQERRGSGDAGRFGGSEHVIGGNRQPRSAEKGLCGNSEKAGQYFSRRFRSRFRLPSGR